MTSSTIRIQIEVIKARALAAADYGLSGSASDPYCVVKLGSSEHVIGKTEVKTQTLEPVWSASFEHDLSLTSFTTSWLVFEVWDSDTLSADDELGAVRLPMRDLADKLVEAAEGESKADVVVLHGGWLKLLRPHHVSGEIEVKIQVEAKSSTKVALAQLMEEPLTTAGLNVEMRVPERVKIRIHDIVFCSLRGTLILTDFHVIFVAYDLDTDSTFRLPIGSVGGFRESESWRGEMRIHNFTL